MRDGAIKSPLEALADFQRFPKACCALSCHATVLTHTQWMWKNEVMTPFVKYLRHHNDQQANPLRRVSFYGLDLYSLHRSAQAVIAYLDTVDPAAAARARQR